MRRSRVGSGPGRWRFRAALQWNRLVLIGLEELSRVQAQAITDRRVSLAIQALVESTAESVGDLTILLERQGGRPLPLAGLTRGASWAAGCLVSAIGERAALALDRWVFERWLRACTRSARWLPPEDGLTARALEAVREREAGCLRALCGGRIPPTRRPTLRRRGR
jgi:hypothetical protein